MIKQLGTLSLTTLLLAGGTTAWAGRPLATEDAGVIERGACEVESFFAHATERASPSISGASVQLGCGIAGNTQVALAVATARGGGETERGIALNGKTALGEPANGNAWAVAWGLAAVRPDGGSMKHETSFINGVYTRAIDDALKLHANLGWSRSQSARQSTTGWALALERSMPASIDVMGEVFGNDRDSAPWVQVGLRWTVVPEKFFLDTSLGRQMNSHRPQQFTLGLKAAF